MKLFLATLVVLLPLVYGAEFDPASVNVDSVAEEEKRALLAPTSQITDVQNQICAIISSDPDQTCESVCPMYTLLHTTGYIHALCGSICKTIHCQHL